MSGRTTPPERALDASPFRFAVVASRFHHAITSRLLEGAISCLEQHGATAIEAHWVPGSFELPLACLRRATADPPVSAVVALGCVIRGETPHFEFVAAEAARGLMDAMLRTGIPMSFGVLTTDDEAQARARAGGDEGNKGWDAALGAIEMAAVLEELAGAPGPR